jgi:hypothetical protein
MGADLPNDGQKELYDQPDIGGLPCLKTKLTSKTF